MKILGLKIWWLHSGNRHQKRIPTKLERLENKALMDAARRNPGGMVKFVDKFGKLPKYQVDEMEPVLTNIRSTIYEKVGQYILKHRSRELISRIDGMIDEVMGANDKSGEQCNKGPDVNVSIDKRHITPATTYRRRFTTQRPKQGFSLQSFLQTPEVLAFLNKLANQPIKNDIRDHAQRMYIVEQNGQTVVISKKEYWGYLLKQYLRQRKSRMAPPPDIPEQPRITGSYKTLEGLPREKGEGVSGVEPK